MPQVLSLGVGASAGSTELGMGGVGGFLGGGLVPAPVGDEDVLASADVAPVGQHDQPGSGELADDAPDPGGGQVMDGTGQRPGHPHDLTGRAGDDLQVHTVAVVLAGIERPVCRHPVDRDERAGR